MDTWKSGSYFVVLVLLVAFLHLQVATPDSISPVSPSTEMNLAQLTDKNIIPVDSLEMDPEYLSLYSCDLDIYGNYLYMATSYDYNEHGKMIIVDISDPTNLVEAGRVESLGPCRQVGVVNDRAYVADSMDGMWIFNVSDPTNIEVLGQYGDNQLYSFFIDGDIAYLTGYSNMIQIVNVSDPTSIVEIGSYEVSENTSRCCVHVQDNLAYIASFNELEILNVTDPSNPVQLGSVECEGYKRKILLRDDVVFLAIWGQIWGFDVSDPTNPVEIMEPLTIVYFEELFVEGNILFHASYTGLRGYNISSSSLSPILGQFTPNGDAMSVTSKDGYLYLVDQYNGVWSLEHDCDEDELYSRQEFELGTPPDNPDADSDAIPDGWEVEHGLDPLFNDAHEDADGDTLDNLLEYEIGTDPNLVDTDQDTYSDDWEYNHGFNPLDPTVGGAQFLTRHPEWISIGLAVGLGTIVVAFIIIRLRLPDEPALSHYGQV